jgi:predicted DCC family thiol-disulfide oxidoreductase YuxK
MSSPVEASELMQNVTVWFDGNCPLCLREIALMRRLDKRGAITFLDLTNGNTDCPVNRADMLARFHAAEDGVVHSGAAAFAAMWRSIPVLRPLGLLARNRHVLRLLENLYLQFLRIRPALQARMIRRASP